MLKKLLRTRVSVKMIAAIVMGVSAVCTPATAQDYPARPIQFIVPYTPGTTGDMLARLLGAKIAQRWNASVVVENKAGASGIIGTDAVAKAAPDGYTFLFTATSHGTIAATSAANNTKLPYDAIRSFAPVSLLGKSAMTLVVTNALPVQNLREFILHLKRQPGVLNYASPGLGSSQQLAMELFRQETGTQMLHVPYKGSAGALSDVAAGHVHASVASVQSASAMTQSGKLRMLAVMGRERTPAFPQVPTFVELGYPNMLVETWYGMFAPAGTPPALVTRMSGEIDQLLTLPEVRDTMQKQGVEPAGGKPERLDTLLRAELKLWTQVVSRAKIVVQ